ncbi:MAG: outer membrane protein assembly factor BamA [Rhodothermales bacterium]
MWYRRCLSSLFLLLLCRAATAQWTLPSTVHPPDLEAARPFEVQGLRVEGVDDEGTRGLILQASGLAVGQTVMIPRDPALTDAIRTLYRLGLFSDVKILEERRTDTGIFLIVRVQEVPRLAGYTFEGVKKKHQKDLRRKVPLFPGGHLRPNDVERAVQITRDYFADEGYLLAEVDARQQEAADGTATLTFVIDRGPRVEVGEIVVEGNKAVSGARLRKQMHHTKEKRWWRIWKSETLDRDAYEEDLTRIVAYYHEKGHYDARIVGDTTYVRQNDNAPEVVVEVEVYEGPRYHIRHILWEGNTVLPDAVLTEALGFMPGDLYNSKKLEQNLYANRRGTDVAGLYLNQGYLQFNIQPSVAVVEGDSLDLHFDVFEGPVYTFGEITIAGNVTTRDHVIRRELFTTPGQIFSRDAIQESIRRLLQLNYFDPASLASGPEIHIDEEHREVDLTYTVEEVFKNPLQIAGTVGNSGLILQFGLTFNNFSVKNLFKRSGWRPLPLGDGQQLSLSVQTSGADFQRYSFSFTEPWFRGRPTPMGFSLSHTRIKDHPLVNHDGSLITSSARFFYDQRLQWPDDHFSLSSGVRYQFYDNDEWTSGLPQGISRELVFRQGITRNSLNHPIFPTQGSLAQLSVEVAPPFPGFIQYHKWRLKTNWNVPLAKTFSFGLSTDFGYVGSLTGDAVTFQRFVVGGSPFETQGVSDVFGHDIVYMRGYPVEAIGPRREEINIGGRILNKYAAEFQWHAVQTPQLTAVPYLFMDAANTWNTFGSYDPTDLFRSAGVGVRLALPMLGLVEVAYGYNFDTFPALGDHDGRRGWGFQFSLGRSFGF